MRLGDKQGDRSVGVVGATYPRTSVTSEENRLFGLQGLHIMAPPAGEGRRHQAGGKQSLSGVDRHDHSFEGEKKQAGKRGSPILVSGFEHDPLVGRSLPPAIPYTQARTAVRARTTCSGGIGPAMERSASAPLCPSAHGSALGSQRKTAGTTRRNLPSLIDTSTPGAPPARPANTASASATSARWCATRRTSPNGAPT